MDINIKVLSRAEDDFGELILKDSIRSLPVHVKEKIEETVCDKHGKSPIIKSTQYVGDRFTLEIEYCCTSLELKVQTGVSS